VVGPASFFFEDNGGSQLARIVLFRLALDAIGLRDCAYRAAFSAPNPTNPDD